MNTRPVRRGAQAPIEVRLVVWQFVRVMVQLETVARTRGRQGAPSIYGAWRPAWQEVDRRLTELGKTDATAFSDLMMEQEVVLQCRGRGQLNELVRTVDNVINQLKSEIKAASGDARRITDLRFERTEMETLGRRVRKLGRSDPARRDGARDKSKSAANPKPRGSAKSGAKPGSKPGSKPGKGSGRRPTGRRGTAS